MAIVSFPRSVPLLLLAAFGATAPAAEAPFSNDFEKAATGKVPENVMVLSGDFLVKEEAGNKFVELPGSPLDTFGMLFGPAETGDVTASGRFYGTKQGRKFPAFGISVGGVSGYKLQMSGGKKALELFKGEDARQSVPFEWPSGSWIHLRIQVRKTASGSKVEGKAWPDGSKEPEAWNITLEDVTPPPAGRSAIWGAPYAGTAIRFDDLSVGPAK